jgi:ketosteroid isomerase-like protein
MPAAHDLHAQNRSKDLAAIVAAERAFNKLSVDSATQLAFNRFLSADALIFRPRAVRAFDYARKHPLPADLILTWEPEYADVSRAGDFGYTTGTWASGSRSVRADPKFGQYVTIWRKQKDGSWLVAFNGTIRTPAPAGNPQKLQSPATSSDYISKATSLVEKKSLLDADNAFAAAAKKSGYVAALRPIAHADVRTLRNTIFQSVGIDSIARSHRTARVTMWMPIDAIVAASGDLGYTRGSYVVSQPNGSYEAGDYVRLWRRDRDGTWRVTLDILSPGG